MDNTCQAIQDGAMVTFDPFEMIETDGIEATMIGHLCGKPAHYMLRGKYNVEYKTCAAHLALLVDESAGDWDGGVVAVTKIGQRKGTIMENWTARYKGMVAVVLTLLLAVTLVSSYSSTRPAEAAALTNSTWCRYHDSLALLAGSSGTGYLTTGYNSPDGTYQRTEFGWWKRATDLANATWGITSDNYSRNGASVASFLPGGQWPSTTGAVADIGNKQPDLVIISLGTNEYLAQLPPEQFSINLNELITNLRAASSRTSILLTIQWHVARTNPTYPWGQYTSVIYNTAVNRSTAMVDLRQYIPYLPAGATDIAKIYNTDRIHLTDAGQMIVGAAFWTWFFSC